MPSSAFESSDIIQRAHHYPGAWEVGICIQVTTNQLCDLGVSFITSLDLRLQIVI